jgi:hypothetical protein
MELWAKSGQSHSLPLTRPVMLTQPQFDAMSSGDIGGLLQDVFFVRDESSIVPWYAFL